MGVPALFRWLSAKYPKIVEKVVEASSVDEEGNEVLINLKDANPNGTEFDNLYLDMNGIIHPCCHPMDKPAPATEEEMMVEIFKYIDRIFAMIRPRKLLFMAIDGVAPRAKMNQQRSRRFRAARERREKLQKATELREERALALNEDVDGDEDEGLNGEEHFDSNCITPGTKFMALIASSIKYYIVERMSNDEAWKGIKVIFSDANVPGEGEHKIVDYIRRQRLDPDYDPNTKHAIYGLDADLIMLSMATHEPYFKVLREDVFYEEQVKYNACSFCGIKGHSVDFCPKRAESDPTFKSPISNGRPFIFLNVAILREYLEAELRPVDSIPFKFNLERAIDDWIFLCFFVGNDFLPHLPSLEIREGAVDLLIEIYKNSAYKMGGYICNNGNVDLKRVQFILEGLAQVEDKIFVKRKEKEDRKEANMKRRQPNEFNKIASLAEHSQKRDIKQIISKEIPPTATETIIDLEAKSIKEIASAIADDNQSILKQKREANMIAAKKLKNDLATTNDDTNSNSTPNKRPMAPEDDDVRLWEPGCKERYYLSKFYVVMETRPEVVQKICKSYLEGLCWVMAYYYQGCPSWKWFYPFHFAPFASDLMKNVDSSIDDVETNGINFELGEPFRPFDQLMGVFPTDSRELVPEPFRPLMTDPSSEIIDFYPEDFAIDLNGKKQSWQGVVLLPFIEEVRLLDALEKVYPQLESKDLKLNERGDDRVFLSYEDKVAIELVTRLNDKIQPIALNPLLSNGLAGYVGKDISFPELEETYHSPLPDQGCPDIHNLSVCCLTYFFPYYERIKLRHKTNLLPDAILPSPILTPEDIANVRSGAASKRVPGRLMVEYKPPVEEYGRHSMHQEHAREYERRDSGHSSKYNQHYQRRERPPSSSSSSSERRYEYPPSNHYNNQRNDYSSSSSQHAYQQNNYQNHHQNNYNNQNHHQNNYNNQHQHHQHQNHSQSSTYYPPPQQSSMQFPSRHYPPPMQQQQQQTQSNLPLSSNPFNILRTTPSSTSIQSTFQQDDKDSRSKMDTFYNNSRYPPPQ